MGSEAGGVLYPADLTEIQIITTLTYNNPTPSLPRLGLHPRHKKVSTPWYA
jgi:hypothetical protein